MLNFMEMINVLSEPGLSNCSWSSCREGCTRDIFSCHHIIVEYTYLQEDYRIMTLLREKQGILDPSPTKHTAVLFVNVKGCGYPPSVNCTTWIARFGAVGSTFPCHYARTNQSLAITHLDTQVGCDWWRADHVTPTRRRTCGTC